VSGVQVQYISNEQDQYGKTERTRAFAEPQSARRPRTEVKSKTEASAAAAKKKELLKRRSRD
jgi:hypothetical protein